MPDISAREIILAKSGMEDIMKQTWVTLTRKAAVCLLAVPVLAGLSGCTQKLADPTSTKQTKEAQATPTGTPFPYYASLDDEPRTISGKCGNHAEWSYSTGTTMPRKSSFLYRILWKDAQAFYECHRLKKFVCGGSIKKIGTQAFRGAIKKDGVVLEDSLEDVEVGEEVF